VLSTPAQETIGAAPTMIAMLLPCNGAAPLVARARDDFKAARLAVADLGGSMVRPGNVSPSVVPMAG